MKNNLKNKMDKNNLQGYYDKLSPAEQEKFKQEYAVQTVTLLQRLNAISMRMRSSDSGFIASQKPVSPDGKSQVVTVERVDFLPEGGVLTFYVNKKFPAKGFAIQDTVDRLNILKKSFMNGFKSLARMFKQNKIKAAMFVLFFKKQAFETARGFVESFYEGMQPHMLKDNMWCQCVKEVRRTFDEVSKNSNDKKLNKEFIEKLKSSLSLLLEFDDAYRYRFQWVLAQFNKEENVIKEIKRLLLLVAEHEIEGEQYPKKENRKYYRLRDRAVALSKIVTFLKLEKTTYRFIKEFIEEVDLKEIELSIEDKYHAVSKTNFNWELPKQEEYEQSYDEIKSQLKQMAPA